MHAKQHYYLSVQEMLLLTRIHSVNLLIVTQGSTGEFQEQGHFDEGSGPHSVIWLQGDVRRSASKRTHYERLLRTDELCRYEQRFARLRNKERVTQQAQRDREKLQTEQERMSLEDRYSRCIEQHLRGEAGSIGTIRPFRAEV